MLQEQTKWILEYKNPKSLIEYKIGSICGLHINSTIAYSYLNDVTYLYPQLISENGVQSLILHTKQPSQFFGRVYKIYRHKQKNRVRFYIPIPSHCRSALVSGRRRVMYDFLIYFDEHGEKVFMIKQSGGGNM